MNIETCREIAARIWCDHEMSHLTIDVYLCEEIAELLHKKLPTFSIGDSVIANLPGTWIHNKVCIIINLKSALAGMIGLEVKTEGSYPPCITVLPEKCFKHNINQNVNVSKNCPM